MSSNNITDRVIRTCERIENMDSHHDMNPLDVKVECSLDGTVREITLVLTTGGPHIEVNVSTGTVHGHWSESHSAPIMHNEQIMDDAHEYYKRQFEENF